jgi:hypothetical protein
MWSANARAAALVDFPSSPPSGASFTAAPIEARAAGLRPSWIAVRTICSIAVDRTRSPDHRIRAMSGSAEKRTRIRTLLSLRANHCLKQEAKAIRLGRRKRLQVHVRRVQRLQFCLHYWSPRDSRKLNFNTINFSGEPPLTQRVKFDLS